MASEDVAETEPAQVGDNPSGSVAVHETSTATDSRGTEVPIATTTVSETIAAVETEDNGGEVNVEELLKQMGYEPRGPRDPPSVTNTQPKPGRPTKSLSG